MTLKQLQDVPSLRMQSEVFWKPQAQEFQTASQMERDLHGPRGVFGRRRHRQLQVVAVGWGGQATSPVRTWWRRKLLLMMLGELRADTPMAWTADAAVSGLVTAWLISRES